MNHRLTNGSTRAADRAGFEINGSWPPPGKPWRYAAKGLADDSSNP